MRERLGGEWTSAIEHALASGAVEFDDRGQLKLTAE